MIQGQHLAAHAQGEAHHVQDLAGRLHGAVPLPRQLCGCWQELPQPLGG